MAKKPHTVRILNRSHTSVTLSEPMPNPEKPGDAPPLRSFALEGQGAVSEVDADVYKAWKDANPHHPLLTGGALEEVGADYEAPVDTFGHEPVLEALSKDKDQVKAAEAGSTVTETPAGGLTSEDMTPDNSTPPGDDPGEPRHASQPGEPEPARRGRRS